MNLSNFSFSIKKTLFCLVFSAVYIVLYRLLLPHTDEPDYAYRFYDVLNNFDDNIIFRFLNYFYSMLSLPSECLNIKGTMSSINFDIDDSYCQYRYDDALYRSILTVGYIFFLIIFTFISTVLIKKYNSWVAFSDRLMFCSLSLCFPSVIYYFGLIGLEQTLLFFSLIFFIFFEINVIVLIIITIMMILEPGVAIVVLAFYLLNKLNYYVLQKYGYSKLRWFSFLVIVTSYFLGLELLHLLYGLPVIGQKAAFIYEQYTTVHAEVYTKHPIIFRPVITLMGMMFMTASGVKAVLLYPLFAIFLCFSFIKLQRSLDTNDECSLKNVAMVYTVFTLIISFAFILPGFTNAKYYIFLFPFLIYAFRFAIDFKYVFLLSLYSNIIVIMSLIFFRL